METPFDSPTPPNADISPRLYALKRMNRAIEKTILRNDGRFTVLSVTPTADVATVIVKIRTKRNPYDTTPLADLNEDETKIKDIKYKRFSIGEVLTAKEVAFTSLPTGTAQVITKLASKGIVDTENSLEIQINESSVSFNCIDPLSLKWYGSTTIPVQTASSAGDNGASNYLRNNTNVTAVANYVTATDPTLIIDELGNAGATYLTEIILSNTGKLTLDLARLIGPPFQQTETGVNTNFDYIFYGFKNTTFPEVISGLGSGGAIISKLLFNITLSFRCDDELGYAANVASLTYFDPTGQQTEVELQLIEEYVEELAKMKYLCELEYTPEQQSLSFNMVQTEGDLVEITPVPFPKGNGVVNTDPMVTPLNDVSQLTVILVAIDRKQTGNIRPLYLEVT